MFFPATSKSTKIIEEARAAALASLGGAELVTEIEVKDVVLHNGTILPARKLHRQFYRLADGSKVNVRPVMHYNGVSNRTDVIGFEVVGA